MKDYHKQVLIKVTTDSQYDSIKPILEEFVKRRISFDIFIPSPPENPGNVNSMFNNTVEIIKEDGHRNIIRKAPSNKRYHLALITPNYEQGINAKYFVKYSYGPSHSVKPKLTHQTHRLNHYHGYIVHSKRDAEIFSTFSKTHLLPDLKYIGFKSGSIKKTNNETILFLPSWEGQGKLDWILTSIKELKKKYKIIVKLHPYGDYGSQIPSSVQKVKLEIKNNADEFYDGEASVKELLSRSSLVVSDISGAVFDALYTGVPITMYSDDLNKYDLNGIKSSCTKYVEEGYISISRNANELVAAVTSSLKRDYYVKQKILSNDIFCRDFTQRSIKSWMKVIKFYLNDEINQEYVAMHNILSNDFWHIKNELNNLNYEMHILSEKLLELQLMQASQQSIKGSLKILIKNIKRRSKRS